jgi:hypothetical protein
MGTEREHGPAFHVGILGDLGNNADNLYEVMFCCRRDVTGVAHIFLRFRYVNDSKSAYHLQCPAGRLDSEVVDSAMGALAAATKALGVTGTLWTSPIIGGDEGMLDALRRCPHLEITVTPYGEPKLFVPWQLGLQPEAGR